ncbi:hypothetical protein [Rubrivirga litoralis]|uniref:Capsule assembly protein Wzi n=1 Tax=Rubrivirga litoralis TaxID=3075598 RepID=A0ABU3BMU1_9BACT|nr:hypothetical protein [Rubrivirga sp. F394]MDT0630609.1 hypothetical protein [Rubrivirga sp. F394]
MLPIPLARLRPALALVLALLAAGPVRAQREGLLDVGSPLSDLLERQAAAGHLGTSVGLLPISAAEGAVLLDTLAARALRGEVALSRADAELLARYQGRSPATAFGRRAPLGLYADGVSPVSYQGDGYAFEASPLLYLAAGPTRRTAVAGRDGSGLVYQNSRGLRVAGHLGRLFFESRALENQRRPALLDYSVPRRTTPRLGFVKLSGGDTYDYFSAEGVVGYRDRFVEARFGRTRNRWGPGQGTLFLSDYAAPYDHLQLRASAGPVRYASTFARFTTPDRSAIGGDGVLPSKYGAFHQLTLTVGRVELEAFEAVVFHDDTLNGNRSGFEIGYLNPVIFYRSVESELGSGDNALIGLGGAVRPVDGVQAYGQVLIDEFVARTFFEDAWTNKWGLLAGVHAVDLVPGLEARAEYARLRPYLYGHRTEASAYVHYNDVLGHPAGPNASDAAVFLRYRPSAAVTAALNVARTRRGRDPDSVYVGADPRVPYTNRVSDVAPTLDGVAQTEWLVEARLGYEVLPRLVVEGAAVYQSLDDAERGRDRALTGLLQLRWGLPFRSERF